MYHGRSGRALGAFAAGAALAVVIGGYLLYGPGGRRRRDELEYWIEDAKGRIVERMSELKETSQASYNAIVDEVLADYGAARELTEAQLRRLGARLKARFREMRELARESAEDARRETELYENQ